MRATTCPLCHSNNSLPVCETGDWQHFPNERFVIVRCQNCRVLYLDPRPTSLELQKYYPADYQPFISASQSKARGIHHHLAQYGIDKRCRVVTRFASSGEILDIGCATGEFLNRMRQFGNWKLTGVEADSRAADYARQEYKLDVVAEPIDKVNFPNESFDVITLWDVLEHLPQPVYSLAAIRKWLKPNGWLILRTPNAHSPYAHFFGQYWAGYDSPRHLTIFDTSSIQRLLNTNGFSLAKVWTLSGSHALTVLSLKFWLRALNRPNVISLIIDHPISKIISAPLFWLIDRGGGALVTVAAQKRDQT